MVKVGLILNTQILSVRNLINISKMYSLNKPCFCGSGKLYKRCHVNIPHRIIKEVPSKKVVTTASNFLSTTTKVLDKKPTSFSEVKFVKDLKNLPTEIKDHVINETQNFDPTFGECVPLSMYLSSSIENVKLEIGVFKTVGVGSEFRKIKPINDRWYDYEFNGGQYVLYVDDNGEKWGLHCWNSYNGIHFDSLKDFVFKISEPKEWIKYKQLQSVEFVPKSLVEKEMVKELMMKRIF